MRPDFDPKNPRRFWISDYPILCYHPKKEDNKLDEIIMVNLIDKGAKHVSIPLRKDEEFVCFIDHKNPSHSVMIRVLTKITQ